MKGREIWRRDVLYAHAVGLVEGRVADPVPDPRKRSVFAGLLDPNPGLSSENLSGSGSMC